MSDIQNNKNGNFLRRPPSSIEAEQALLSAIITNNRAMEKVSEFLRPEHFVELSHKKIYATCARLIEKGHLADVITLKNYLSQSGELENVGGVDYLMNLANNSASSTSVEAYGRLIYECALKRELIEIGENIKNNAYGDSDNDGEILTPNAQIQIAEEKLYNLATDGSADKGPTNFGKTLQSTLETIQSAYQSDGSISGISTGFNDLDKIIGGLHSSDLIIIAGRPAMGKTAFALNIAFNVANEVLNKRGPDKLQGPVVFFSLEMSQDQLATRILSSSAEVPGNKIRNGSISEDEFNRITEHSRALETLPLFIDDTPDLSVSAIRTRARRLKRQHGKLSAILIDYIQLLNSPGGRKSENRVLEISEMTRGLKMLAKELEVPVIALSQLSRAVDNRDDKKPQLSDLRESGSIEQDADMVMFVYREAYYIENRPPKDEPGSPKYLEWQKKVNRYRNMAEILIEKQRHGSTGSVALSYIGEYSKFDNFYNGTDPYNNGTN